jgi:hypothetical protein
MPMALLLQSRVQKLVKFISSLFLFWVFSFVGYAQTTLSSGDILIVSINSSNSTIEIVPLIDLQEATIFSIEVASNIESTIKVILKTNLNAGNSLVLTSSSTDQFNTDGQLLFNEASDKVTILQKELGIQQILCIASWGNKKNRDLNWSNSNIPHIHLVEGLNHQYYLKNGASGTPTMIAKMVTDPTHWQVSENPFPKLGTSFKILTAPVIVFSKNFSTIMEGDSIPLNVAIYEHDGSRLTVDVVVNEAFSTADTNDIYSFRSHTYNFTGLIGDAVYEIAIPQYDDRIFEDRETVFFELQNLSSGNFGDFINHATFIVDNEIPDVKILPLFDSKDINGNFIELVNNEKVYVDINNWEIHVDENKRKLDDVMNLAPFERRRISISEIIKAEDKIHFFKPAQKYIRLVDARGNNISLIDLNNTQQYIPKIVESKKQKLTLGIESSKNNQVQIPAQISEFRNIKEPKILPKEGWVPLHSFDEKADLEIIFWDEKLTTFRDIITINPDSMAGLSFFQYLTPNIQIALDEPLPKDSLESENMVENISEKGMVLSATDADNNGVINGSEGYNFVQYRGLDSILVSNFIHHIEDKIGDKFIHPEIFKIDESLEYHSLMSTEYLMDEDFVWIKADSIFERTEFMFETNISYPIEDESEVFEEPVSNFVIKASSSNGASTTSFNFYDKASSTLLSRLNLCMNIGYNMCNREKFMFGAFVNNNWSSDISLIHQNETLFSYPLGFTNGDATDISLQIEHWNMEVGWKLFIEDIETNEKIEFLYGENFNFEYFVDTTPKKTIVEEGKNLSKKFILNRYQLLITSPEFEELIQDKPEKIELKQNYPNPFNPATMISFYLPENQDVKLSIFNVVGQLITILENGPLQLGEHQYDWNATGYPSGMYIYQLEVANKVITRKMTLVK